MEENRLSVCAESPYNVVAIQIQNLSENKIINIKNPEV